MGNMVIALFRPKPDKAADLMACMRDHLPVLRAQKRLRLMAEGKVLEVIATDRMAEIDLPHFCDQSGHVYLGMEPAGEATRHVIRAGQAMPDRET